MSQMNYVCWTAVRMQFISPHHALQRAFIKQQETEILFIQTHKTSPPLASLWIQGCQDKIARFIVRKLNKFEKILRNVSVIYFWASALVNLELGRKQFPIQSKFQVLTLPELLSTIL